MRASSLLFTLSEADFQTRIIDRARTLGWWVHHGRPARKGDGSWSTPIQGDAGFPDLVLARGGRVIFVEVKTEKGRLTDQQKQWMAELAGGPWTSPQVSTVNERVEVYLWRPSDTARIEGILQ